MAVAWFGLAAIALVYYCILVTGAFHVADIIILAIQYIIAISAIERSAEVDDLITHVNGKAISEFWIGRTDHIFICIGDHAIAVFVGEVEVAGIERGRRVAGDGF